MMYEVVVEKSSYRNVYYVDVRFHHKNGRAMYDVYEKINDDDFFYINRTKIISFSIISTDGSCRIDSFDTKEEAINAARQVLKEMEQVEKIYKEVL